MLSPRKYSMRDLKNILDLEQFTYMVREGKKDPHASCAWWNDCVDSVKISIYQDRTSTSENLHEKAKNYALNYLSTCIEVGFIDRTSIANEIANEVEEDFKDYVFDTTPPAYSVASKERKKVLDDPEEEYIRLKYEYKQ